MNSILNDLLMRYFAGGGTFRWDQPQRRWCSSQTATTEPMDLYCTA